MNAIHRLLRSHRSIRKFERRAVPDALLRELVRCGQAAASSSNVQAVTVIHVTDPAVRESIAALAGGQSYVATAGAFVVWCADLYRSSRACEAAGGRFAAGMTEQFIIATVDVALAAQNAAVAAESSGLGICYIGGIRNDPAQVTKLLKLPQHVYPVFGMCLGYPAQDPEVKPRMPLDAVLMEDVYDDAGQGRLIAEYDAQMREYYHTRTGGNKSSSWSEEMKRLVGKESRPHMREYLASQGFTLR